MTDEKLIRANEIKHKLENTEEQIDLIVQMEEQHACVTLSSSEIGLVILDEETRDTVCGIVLNHLLAQARDLKQEFDEL